jgi:hypothetical protein
MIDRVIDRTAMLGTLTDTQTDGPAPTRTHPRNVRIMPKSRDFH